MANKLGHYRHTTNDKGELVVERLGKSLLTGNEKWVVQPEGIPEGLTMQGTKIGPRTANMSKKQVSESINRARQLYSRGQESKIRAEDAQNTGGMKSAAIFAGREVDKLRAGLADIGDFVVDIASGGSENAMARTYNRQKDQEEKDRLFREFDEEAGLSKVGAALPYMVSGTFGAPAGRALSGKLFEAVERGVDATGRAGRGILSRGVAAASRQRGPVGYVGRKAQREIATPLQTRAANKARQIREVSPYREGVLKEIGAGGIIGAVEGGIHYDNDPINGAIAGLLGTSSGQLIKPYVSRAPTYWNANEQRLVDWAKSKGMKLLPGMQTGSRRLQKFEHGLREGADFADSLGPFDRNNEVIFNRTAWEAAGLDPGKNGLIEPNDLQIHMNNLQMQYKQLEAKTVGQLKARHIKTVDDELDKLLQMGTPEALRAYKTAMGYRNMMDKMTKVTRNSRGKFKRAEFNGKDYQDLRSRLKRDMDGAWNNNQQTKAHTLKIMIDELDKGMELGIKNLGGEATVSQWKELNEKYAMSNLLLERGTNLLGKTDARKLGNYLMENDAKRTLLESGGRIQDLQKLAKVEFMMRNQAGSGLSGSNMHSYTNSGKQSIMQALMQNPVAGRVPLLPATYMAMYKKGYPSVTGLMNLTGKNAGDISRYTRAVAQGTQAHPKAINAVKKGYQTVEEYINRILSPDWDMSEYETESEQK